MSCQKVGAFCQHDAKERRKALKKKPDKNLEVDFFVVCWIGAARDVPTTSFYVFTNNCFVVISIRKQMAHPSSGSQCFSEATISS